MFLSNFEWGERKEPWLLLKGFNDEFTAGEPVRLVCKIINKDPEVHVRRESANLRLKESGGKISFVYNREFPYYQLGAFYRSADCFISAGRGEGWDMPLMEAMACGLPSIATDWGALAERVATDTRNLAFVLFRDWVLPFEIVGVLLLAAVVGGVFLAKRERGRDGEREGGQFR